MSWKSITCVAVMCALMASQALADPTIHVDLRRNANGNPILNANGNFEWIVTVAPDPTRFVTPGVGAENAGITGGSVAIEAGFTLSASANDGLGAGLSDFLVGATTGAAFTGANTDNAGSAIFTWEDAAAGGLQTSVPDDQVYAALGSLFLTSNGTTPNVGVELDANGRTVALVIEAEGPSTTTTLSTRLIASGAYGGNGLIAQDNGDGIQNDVFTNFNADVSFRTLGGDANLDGVTNLGDFAILQNNFNQPGTTWAQGNFNGDAAGTNLGDFAILQNNFNMSAPAPGALTLAATNVPEPSTALLCGVAALGFGVAVRRRAAR